MELWGDTEKETGGKTEMGREWGNGDWWVDDGSPKWSDCGGEWEIWIWPVLDARHPFFCQAVHFSVSPHFSSLHFPLSPSFSSSFLVVMGIQREPGQKGVSWSNIAVGEYYSGNTLLPPSDSSHVLCPLGGIMNMV